MYAGSVAIILPPLLYGSTAGGSLRSDWRKIEDKLVNNCRVELRNFVVNLNMQDIHKNRELPAAFLCWIGVPDSTLPNKGTAHRALRSGGEAPPGQVNVLLGVERTCLFIFRPPDVSQYQRRLNVTPISFSRF